jgi:germacradienol/geosmin synthase
MAGGGRAGEPLVPSVAPEGERRARLNPHVEAARAHTRAWARAMGIVAAEADPERLTIWDDAAFEAMDFALFAAYAHPDAPAAVLDLLADWYVWLFYFDDALEEVYARGGMAAAKALIAATNSFTPAVTSSASPANPAERGLVDLWARTAPLGSAAWVQRLADHLQATLNEMRWALANIDQHRMPNPIEHVEARRAFGGMPWASYLVELGCSIELDEATVALRPIRLLREAWADAVGLRNDIVSFRKEAEAGEMPSNGVAVVQDFLGCDLGTAAKLVHDLYVARLRQFDRLAAVDLPEVLGDLDVDADTPALVERWIDGMRDWLAGDEQWAMESGRYFGPTPGEAEVLAQLTRIARGPTGLGTSAARPANSRAPIARTP